MDQEHIFANALNRIDRLGAARLTQLLKYFGSFKAAWQAKESQYRQAGLDHVTISEILEKKPYINPDRELESIKKLGINILIISDKSYPPILKEIPAAPPILYYRGNIQAVSNLSLAIVGSRKMTLYGKQAITALVPDLVASGLNIVSGLAFGIDAQALTATIEAGGIPVAVLATPIDDSSISPRANFNLAQKVIQSGCVISEYGLNASVQKQNFPIRNRIIAGLSLGTLVIEADTDSGSLITANYALEQNREVFALPGSIFSDMSRGTNDLIKKGAKTVTTAADIIEELNLEPVVSAEIIMEANPEENLVLNHLTHEPLHIDELTKLIGKPVAEVSSLLTMLEIKGRVKNLGAAKYVRIR